MTLEQLQNLTAEVRLARTDLTTVIVLLESLLKDGLKGNRAVAGTLWSVVTAATRAFPIQLSPSVERAQAVVGACPALDLDRTWIHQALTDGSLVTLVQKLQSQPQILTAYDTKAPIRNANSVQQLVSVLRELQALATVTPYDKYVQQQAAQEHPAARDLVRVQTEEDLPQHSHHHSNSSTSTQQQDPQDAGQSHADSAQEPNRSWTASRSLSMQETAAAAAESQPSTAEAASAAASPNRGKHLLLGAVARKPAGNASSNNGKGLPPISPKPSTTQAQQQQDMSSNEPNKQQHISLHLQVVEPAAAFIGQAAEGQQQQHMVKVTIQALPESTNSRKATQGSSIGSGVSASRSSSSSLLGAGADAVKGYLHGLQQSASSSIQQSATAAGHEISGAVAAAGGAVAAAIGQPLAVAKGLAAAATSRASGKKQIVNNSSSSKSPRSSPDLGLNEAEPSTAPAAAASAADRGSSLRLPKFFKHKHSGAAAAVAAGSGSSDQVQQAAALGTATPPSPTWQLVRLQLLVPEHTSSSDLAIKCLITPATAAVPPAQADPAASNAFVTSAWGAKSFINRLGSKGRSSAEAQQHDKQLKAEQQGAAAANNGQSTASEGAAGTDGDLLEGDMWSVMARLKNTGASKPASAAAAVAVDGPADPAPSDAVTAAEDLVQTGHQLQQQLLEACMTVSTAAAATKGCLGDESQELLQLVDLLKQLLNHGLQQTGSTGGGGVEGTFTGWLSPKNLAAFAVLQALQHGSKQHPRLMLGADSISNMQAAKAASPAAKLDLWVRSSLNEQLLAVRLSTLVANPTAVAQWYQPQALLLQQQQMQEVLQELSGLLQHKFALLVEAPTAAGAGASGAATSSSSKGSVMDARKLLGGFSKSLGALRSGGSSSSSKAAPAVTSTAVGADPNPQNPTNAPAASSSSSSSIPTFLWSALGSSSSSNPAAADSSSEAAAAGQGSILKRGQRRLANILEVRVPPPDSSAVLSPENSCALSPVSTPGDAAYAEWWSPNGSWDELAAAAAANAGDQRLSSGSGDALQSGSESDRFDAYFEPGELRSGSVGSVGSRGALSAAAAGSSAGRVSAGGTGRKSSFQPPSAGSEAARKIEQELTAAMSAPLQVLLERSRKTGSSSGSSGGGAVGGRVSGSGSSSSRNAGLHRSSSSGWDAAVAAARARSRTSVGTSVGVSGHQHISSVNLQRRSRSPDASWPSTAAAYAGDNGDPSAKAAQGPEGQSVAAAAAVGLGNVRVRHRHKRSSSLNDLPELAALLESEGVPL